MNERAIPAARGTAVVGGATVAVVRRCPPMPRDYGILVEITRFTITALRAAVGEGYLTSTSLGTNVEKRRLRRRMFVLVASERRDCRSL